MHAGRAREPNGPELDRASAQGTHRLGQCRARAGTTPGASRRSGGSPRPLAAAVPVWSGSAAGKKQRACERAHRRARREGTGAGHVPCPRAGRLRGRRRGPAASPPLAAAPWRAEQAEQAEGERLEREAGGSELVEGSRKDAVEGLVEGEIEEIVEQRKSVQGSLNSFEEKTLKSSLTGSLKSSLEEILAEDSVGVAR